MPLAYANPGIFGGLALENPNDRRRINRLTRAVMQGRFSSPEEAVRTWLENKHLPVEQRHPDLQRTAVRLGITTPGQRGKPARASQGAGASFIQAVTGKAAAPGGKRKGRGKKTQALSNPFAVGRNAGSSRTDAQRAHSAAYARTKRQVINAFKALGGDSVINGVNYGPAYGRGYSKRVLGGQASRYALKTKRYGTQTRKTGKPYAIAGRKYWVPNYDQHDFGAQYWNQKRVSNRAAGLKGHTKPFAKGADGKYAPIPDYQAVTVNVTPWWGDDSVSYSGKMFGGKRSKGGGAKKGQPMNAGAQAGRKRYEDFMSQAKASGMSHKLALAAWKQAKTAMAVGNPGIFGGLALENPGIFGGLALENPGIFGGLALENEGVFDGLALENPTLSGAEGYGRYAIPVVISGGVAGLIHWKVVPMLQDNVYSRIPGSVGSFITDRVPYTLTGVIGGAVLGALAARSSGETQRMLALTAAGVLVSGGALDAFRWASGASAPDQIDLSDLDVDSLSSEAMSGFGGLGQEQMFGDGMSFLLAPLTATDHEVGAAYGQASFADAYDCPDDFSPEEGQAILDGMPEFENRFGRPVRRVQRSGANNKSHLSGQPGHRWAWLIKAIGVRNVQNLCKLPPKQRIKVIREMKAAAIAQFQASMQAAAIAEQQASETPWTGADGADAASMAGPRGHFGAHVIAGGHGV